MLKRLLVIGHVRAAIPGGPAVRALPSDQRAVKPWNDYKPYAFFVAIIDQLYTVMFKVRLYLNLSCLNHCLCWLNVLNAFRREL